MIAEPKRAPTVVTTHPPSTRSPCSAPDRMRRDFVPGSTGELGLPLLFCWEKHINGRSYDRRAEGPLPAVASAHDGPGVREAGAGRCRDQSELLPVPAWPDRDRAGDPCGQRDRDADQERGVPGPEGFRHLRLHGPATPFQAQDHGVSTMRMDWAEVQLLSCWEPRNWENTRGCGIGLGGVPRRPAGAFLHDRGTGEPTGEGTEAVHPRPIPRPA